MKSTLIADTGYLVALANPRDQYHQHVVRISRGLEGDLVTTWPVITETCHFLLRRVHPLAQASLLDKVIRGTIAVYPFSTESLARIPFLIGKYVDLPMDLADASLVILAEELGHGNILSTDRRDFQAYRWKNHHPFKNLLFPED